MGRSRGGQGHRRGTGMPVDLCPVVANQIHDVWRFVTPQEYLQQLKGNFLPAVERCWRAQGLPMFGGPPRTKGGWTSSSEGEQLSPWRLRMRLPSFL